MAGFKDMNVKNAYDSDEDDILGDFYVPVLSKSVRYDRLAGYFSSSTLAAAARGMAGFIETGGKMRLVTSAKISEEDVQAVLRGTTESHRVIADIFLKKLDMTDNLQRDHVAALAWMISQENLEIKIAVPAKGSLYHQKIGIMYDSENQRVTFSGSVNETGNAWNENIEEFKVFCDWKLGQETYGDIDERVFEKFWSGKAKNTRVIDLPTAVREHLIKIAPKTKKEAVDGIRVFTLRPYQREAVRRWRKNNHRGILEMATGTGKTKTAIACINEIFKLHNNEPCLVVISCPTIHLIEQWTKEFKDKRQIVKEFRLEMASGSVPWRKNFKEIPYKLNYNIIKSLIIVTTHTTFSNENFTRMIEKFRVKALIIADEAHGVGTPKTKQGLLERYRYRLGLSATPDRYYDDIGTEFVSNYFEGVVFEFGLDKAIERGYLAQYKFFPQVTQLTYKENDKYRKFSKLIAIEKEQTKPDIEKIEELQFKRARIVKNATNKINVLADIIDGVDELDHCLIYCADTQQIQRSFPILNDKGVLFHQFTQSESVSERSVLISEFANGTKPVLLAIKCLDEGVDIPSAKTAIILASSGNPREFVQRRGRLLRPDNGKVAVIYDIIVLPPEHAGLMESERTLITKELDRISEFASSSENPEVSEELIADIKNKYGVSA